MIVEDEPIVLEGMLKIIKFEDLGFNVVSACANGREALDKFDEAKPDVVITDICMDLMDGLEFIEKASEKSRRTKFVVVSGHQDFKFVKKALSLKVLDYILKPVTAKEFRELLTKIAEELNKKNISLEQFEEMQKSTNELHKSIFLNELINLKFSQSEIQAYLNKYNIVLDKKYFRVLIFEMKDLDTTKTSAGFESINQLINDIHYKIVSYLNGSKNVLSFTAAQGYVVVIANEDDKEKIDKFSSGLAEYMYNYYTDADHGAVNCYLGYDVEDIASISISYNKAAKLIKSGVMKNGTGYYDANYILSKRSEKSYSHKEHAEEWVRNVMYCNNSAYVSLDEIAANIIDACYLLSDFKNIADEMIEMLKGEFNSMNVVFPVKETGTESFEEDELKDFLRNLTKECMDKIDKEGHSKEEYITDKALKYIKKNFSDFNLDLNSVCSHLDISVSYFSSIFKKNTGMTFVMYLNSYRIDKAKYYLEHSQGSISEVGEMVGYVDPHYFGIVFKKYTETTPKKYRTQKREQDEKE